ncbi:MAG: hypothetical protein IPG73_11715 [Ignavibacteria bacterium]|nr:hypothetical protein [Ignavibacteria bacterium]
MKKQDETQPAVAVKKSGAPRSTNGVTTATVNVADVLRSSLPSSMHIQMLLQSRHRPVVQ